MYGINSVQQDFLTKQSNKIYALLIVDDDLFFRQGLITLLNFYNQNKIHQLSLSVVGEAENSEQAIALTQDKDPDLILLDLCLGENKKNGIDILIELKKMHCQAKTLVLSAQHRDKFIFQAMQAGASGYVVKDNLASQLLEAINTIIQGNIYLAPEIATSFFDVFHSHCEQDSHKSQPKFALTERETDVLALLVEGKSNRKIAAQLFITVATVKAHLTSIFHKLEVKSRSQAIVKALKFDLIRI